jgi:hypothetical protein
MNQNWKLVPVEPTQPILDGMTTERKKGNGVLQMWFEALAAAPVPPAGVEVEVFNGWVNGCPEQIELVREHDHRVHITRLQAENAALQQRLNVADQRVDDLETELTKTKRGYEWESQRAAALLEELQEYEGSSGSLQPSLKENHGIPGTSFQRLNQLANEGE